MAVRTALVVAGTDEFRELRATVADLMARVARLERQQRGPRDGADVELLVALARSVGASKFTAHELVAHSALVDADLGAALEAADLTTAKELGQWCRRVADTPIGGFVLVRGRRRRGGFRWQVCIAHLANTPPLLVSQ